MGKHWEPLTDMPSLEGKNVVVTGGTAGIGLQHVRFLALRGATVYLAARSEKKAKDTIEMLVKTNPHIQNGQIIWISLDLADLASVTGAVEALKSKVDHIDILINNAAICTASEDTVADGWEPHMAVNHAGVFAFTNGILPLLKKATKLKNADVRIVTTCSSATGKMLPSSYPFQFESTSFMNTPAPFYPWSWRIMGKLFFKVDMIRYTVSKTANMIFAQELQRLLDEQNLPILSIGTDPGNVGSDGLYDIGTWFFTMLIPFTTIPPEEGAVTPLFAATSKEVRENASAYKGNYLEPFGQLVKKHKVTEDKAQVNGLWENTTLVLNEHLQKRGLPVLQGW